MELHPNTVRLHLDQLVDAGLMTQDREIRDRPGRPRSVYSLAMPSEPGPSTSQPEPEKSSYKLLAEVLVNHLGHIASEPAVEAAVAGRAWGRRLSKEGSAPRTVEPASAELGVLFDQLGFAPRTTGPGQAMEFHRCPFGQCADDHSPVVCGIHLGLMQGALAAAGAPMQATSV